MTAAEGTRRGDGTGEPDFSRAPKPPRARVGLVVPAANRLVERQFHHYAPSDLAVHVGRALVAGKWKRPLSEALEEIERAATALAACRPDLLVFHCTDTSMQEGRAGEERIVNRIASRTGIEALSTSSLVVEALQRLQLRKIVLLSPYRSNQTVLSYLAATGFTVVHDVALGLDPGEFDTITPRGWYDLAHAHDRGQADGFFLSCINTTQLDAIEAIERSLAKPVINSNQAVLWGCLNRLRDALGLQPSPRLGRLFLADHR